MWCHILVTPALGGRGREVEGGVGGTGGDSNTGSSKLSLTM